MKVVVYIIIWENKLVIAYGIYHIFTQILPSAIFTQLTGLPYLTRLFLNLKSFEHSLLNSLL